MPQFEAKAKLFEKSYLKKSLKKALTPLEIETLYWKATVDKPFSIEYANDMPGSAFVPVSAKKSRGVGEAVTVGETAWNMRGVSRSKGSLLRFMKEEIPGVTSPMVYLAMMFSWFAWHVEDHDLHSLNYMIWGLGSRGMVCPGKLQLHLRRSLGFMGMEERLILLVSPTLKYDIICFMLLCEMLLSYCLWCLMCNVTS